MVLLLNKISQLTWLYYFFKIWMLPLRGTPVLSHWEEAPGYTSSKLKGVCLSAGLEVPWGSPVGMKEVSVEKEIWSSIPRELRC